MGMLATKTKKRIPSPEEVEKFINGNSKGDEETSVSVQPVMHQQPQVEQAVQPSFQQVPQVNVVQPKVQPMTQQPVPQQMVIQQPVMTAVQQQAYAVQAPAMEVQVEPMRNFNLRIPVKYHRALKRFLLDYEDGNISMNSYFVEAIIEKLRRDGIV